ncbi:hypothetical protein ACTFIY_008103 [Dictyostelium cf. discoideum]
MNISRDTEDFKKRLFLPYYLLIIISQFKESNFAIPENENLKKNFTPLLVDSQVPILREYLGEIKENMVILKKGMVEERVEPLGNGDLDWDKVIEKANSFSNSWASVMILGDPIDENIVPHLLNDILYGFENAGINITGEINRFKELAVNLVKGNVKFVNEKGNNGDMVRGKKIILCGHGQPSRFILCDGVLSGEGLWKIVKKVFGGISHFPEICVYFNCCFAEEIWYDFLEDNAKSYAKSLLNNKYTSLAQKSQSSESLFNMIGTNIKVRSRFLGTGLMPIEGGLCNVEPGSEDKNTSNYFKSDSTDSIFNFTRALKTPNNKITNLIQGEDPHIFSFANIGCSDCTLICCGSTRILLDGSYAKYMANIWTFIGTLSFDLVIVSHCDQDHISGIKPITKQYPSKIKKLWMSFPPEWDTRSVGSLKKIWDNGNEKGAGFPIHNTKRGYNENLGDFKIRVLSPTNELHDQLSKEITNELTRALTIYNKSCLVIYMKCNGKKMLFTGDAHEDEIISGLKEISEKHIDLDYMDIPHHGSTQNTTEKLFERVSSKFYTWSSDGGVNYPTTMGTQVLHYLYKYHVENKKKTTVSFNFTEFSEECLKKDLPEESEFVELLFNKDDILHWQPYGHVQLKF